MNGSGLEICAQQLDLVVLRFTGPDFHPGAPPTDTVFLILYGLVLGLLLTSPFPGLPGSMPLSYLILSPDSPGYNPPLHAYQFGSYCTCLEALPQVACSPAIGSTFGLTPVPTQNCSSLPHGTGPCRGIQVLVRMY